METNKVNPDNANVVAINPKLFHFSLLKIVKIEFKMKLQIVFGLKFSIAPARHNFSYLSLHLPK